MNHNFIGVLSETECGDEFEFSVSHRQRPASAESEVVKSTNDPSVARNDATIRKRALERWENEGGKVLANSQKSGDSITDTPSNDLVHGESHARYSIQKS